MTKLSLDELLDNKKKVYVKNISRPMGNIVLTFIAANGKAEPREIKRTWIPICLTDTLSPDIIRASNDLRQFIYKKILQLVDPAEAEKILSSEEAQEELKRLSMSDFSAASALSPRAAELATHYVPEGNVNNPLNPGEGMQTDPVNNRVKSTLLRVESKDLTERDAVAEFRIMQGELTRHDLTYIISSVGQEGPLRRFALQLLTEQSAQVDADIVKEPAEDPEAKAAGRAQQVVE